LAGAVTARNRVRGGLQQVEQPKGDRRDRSSVRLQGQVFYRSPFTVVGRVRSFRHAAVGLWFVMRSQHNAWLHAAATALAIALAVVLHFRVRPFATGEWCDLVVAIALVWVAETFNTGLEVLAEAITHERHAIVKIAKDIAAAAVLLAAIGATAVGAILFVPRIVELFARVGGGH
jgi:diacylglycerol kinase (ATP)